MNKAISFFKKESVLCISFLLAIISSFFVLPDAQYLSYIDFNTLALLFCLMAAVAGFNEIGLFSLIGNRILSKVTSTRSVTVILTALCFCFSPFITNDVALITFVPLSLNVLTAVNRKSLIPITVILQTIAANVGSSLTPIGNPQNIYIYSISNMSFAEIFITMLPFAAITIVFSAICVILQPKYKLSYTSSYNKRLDLKSLTVYALLFAVGLLAVFKIINTYIALVIVIAVLLCFNKKILLRVDYSLLLTFVGFFVFVGNMGRTSFFSSQIEGIINGNEITVSAIGSQVISNVPAALLFSGFTDNLKELLIGVNLGGLGTLIASMASLISYRYIAKALPNEKGKYLIIFSVLNFILLAASLLLYIL